jgi:hypothetical protein
MGYVTGELINLFNFLLPGFITIFVFYALTSFPKKSEFDKVVLALIWTVIINLIVDLFGFLLVVIGEHTGSIGEWTATSKALVSIAIAIVFGVIWVYLYNNDTLHRFLRKHKITNQTSYPSEWYGTFSETQGYVTLYFTDGKRLMGYPLEWPTDPKSGHFILEDASWLVDEDGKIRQIELITVSKILVDVTKIDMVEFSKNTQGER